jgi:ATP-dependent RNA helicase DDX19/DBP5
MASLEDRISKPQKGQTAGDAEASTGTTTAKPTSAAGETGSWADETSAADTNSGPSTVEAKAEKEMSSLSRAQTDGASGEQRGTSGIYEPSYEVDVQLSDLQKDSGNPLHSIKSFEELGL